MGIGGGELIVIVLIILLLFGSDKIPEIARGLGKGMNEFKRATDEIKREITAETDQISNSLVAPKSEGIREMRELKNSVATNFDDITNNQKVDELLSHEVSSSKKGGGKRNSLADMDDGLGI